MQVSGSVLEGPSRTRSTSRPPTSPLPKGEAEAASQPLLQRAFEPLQRWAMKAGVYVAFLATKQPGRIRQVRLALHVLRQFFGPAAAAAGLDRKIPFSGGQQRQVFL